MWAWGSRAATESSASASDWAPTYCVPLRDMVRPCGGSRAQWGGIPFLRIRIVSHGSCDLVQTHARPASTHAGEAAATNGPQGLAEWSVHAPRHARTQARSCTGAVACCTQHTVDCACVPGSHGDRVTRSKSSEIEFPSSDSVVVWGFGLGLRLDSGLWGPDCGIIHAPCMTSIETHAPTTFHART